VSLAGVYRIWYLLSDRQPVPSRYSMLVCRCGFVVKAVMKVSGIWQSSKSGGPYPRPLVAELGEAHRGEPHMFNEAHIAETHRGQLSRGAK
jgi:hypothetical protein